VSDNRRDYGPKGCAEKKALLRLAVAIILAVPRAVMRKTP